MTSKHMTSFRKSEDCPSSDKLVEFQSREVPKMTGDKIRRHLAKCEFCSAEVALYTRYPQDEVTSETIEATGIPAPLFELAEALLKNHHFDPITLDSLLKSKRNLVR